MMSLSPNLDAAVAEYGNFLAPLLIDSGLEIEQMNWSESTDNKQQTAKDKETKPGHRIVMFQVRAKGDLGDLVRTLEVIQKTPLLHRVKTLDIARIDTSPKKTNDKLNINMKIEAMMVGRAEPHADGPLAPDQRLVALEVLLALRRAPTGLALLPWVVGPTGPFARQQLAMDSGYRQYGDMDRKNIFRGGEPPPPRTGSTGDDDDLPDDGLDVREYIRLDTADPDNREAFFRNLVFKTQPVRVRSSTWSGFNIFRVYNEWKTKVLYTAKVLRVDQRDVYFQVQDDVYGIHLGQTLADAMRKRLPSAEMERLNLTGLYDAEWATKQIREAAKEADAAKKKRLAGGR